MNIFEEIKYNFRQKENGLIKIILINVLLFVVLGIIYVVSKMSGHLDFFDSIYKHFQLPSNLNALLHRPWTIISYFFAHSVDDLFHILFNMLFLYWFGKIVSEYIGNRRLINLYILGGIFGAVLFLALFNLVPYFANKASDTILVGASGSVFAVVVGAATLVPHYRMNLLLLGPVKITYIAAFFVFGSWLGMVGANSGGNICHLGGALLGYIYIRQLQNGRDLGKPINAIGNFFKNIGKPRLKVSHRSETKQTSDKPSQEDIDKILDKISKSGYESLSKAEKQKLFKASEK